MDEGAVRRLFFRALDVAPESRAAFLENSSAPADVRAAVVRERFGPYQLGPLLGRGGMGAVFRAERVDGELHQTVAIKIADRGWLDPRAFERFRVEISTQSTLFTSAHRQP